MTKPSVQLIRKWYKKAATCPHRPKCRSIRSCDKAVPMDDHLSMYELGGSGGNDPERRAISFVQLNSTFDGDHRDAMTDSIVSESNETFGSADLADHPTAVAWRRFSQLVQELPRNYRGRKGLEALSESGLMTVAAKAGGISLSRMFTVLAKFCAERGVDRGRLLLRNFPVGK